jgi:hypothetical protein
VELNVTDSIVFNGELWFSGAQLTASEFIYSPHT